MHDMPPIFHDSVLPTFVRGYDELMLETFGPTYERPDFKNVLPKRKARRTAEASSEPFESNYFRDYEDFQQQQTQYDYAASGPFNSEQFDVGLSAPQYDVGVSQSQFEQPFGEESYRPMLYVDPIIQVDQPNSRDDPNAPFLDLPPEVMICALNYLNCLILSQLSHFGLF